MSQTGFRQTTFDPTQSQQYQHPSSGQAIDMASMEEKLARQMASMKIMQEKRKREVEKICGESDELKELQAKIKAAYLNKERSAQVTENQYREQQELEQDAQIDVSMLKLMEQQNAARRAEMQAKQDALISNKRSIQEQMVEREKLRAEAYQEYVKEKSQVDAVIQKMIDEDMEMMRISQQKQEQAQADMILSVNEKRAMVKRQKEMEEYEEEMVRRYAAQQQKRADEIQQAKDQAEAEREVIFQQLKTEEERRRAEKEFQENLRNELNVQEREAEAIQKEIDEAEKRQRIKQELMEAKEFQMRLKEERAAEERRMEQEFKQKLMEKFAEDERLEQMNAQKRRMRELEHKREIERLWQEKLALYQAQRQIELEERAAKLAEEEEKARIIEEEKNRLLREHAAILQAHNPKAASVYGTNNFR